MSARVEGGELESDVNGLHFLGEERFTGEAVETSSTGSLLSSTTFVEGVEQGPHRLWHPNGRLEFSCDLHDGNPIGLARTWRDDGSLEEEQQFDEAGDLLWSRRWNADGSARDEPPARSA